ncbi:ArsR/SmtB family transcription factor [Paenibacillus sp. CAU 1782]
MNANIFQALSDPSRLRIVELLLSSAMTVGDIAVMLGIRQPQASKHLRTLLDSGLVEVKAEANRRRYMLRTEPLQEMDQWLESYRTLWEERYDALDSYLQQLKAREQTKHDISEGLPNGKQTEAEG